MDYERAKEIMESPHNIRVLYQGKPVWLESLNANDESVRISSVTLTDGEKTVSVHDLVEDKD
ncbi:MAG: Small acid-soluble spore protein family [Peptococcaceae bacterium]|jgi:small acid-soluble spore protein H (minor)|nr:Small acid-soluble spore protein family [Peptococcaceae bacterium]